MVGQFYVNINYKQNVINSMLITCYLFANKQRYKLECDNFLVMSDFTVLGVTFLVLGTMGYILNAISLSYFIRRERNGLSNQLLILLIITDLVLCFTLPFLFYASDAVNNSNEYYAIINFLVQTSGIVTTTLSIVRAISIKNPLMNISSQIVWAVIIVLYIFSFNSNVYVAVVGDKRMGFYIGIAVFAVCMVLVSISGIYSYRLLKRVRISVSDLTLNNIVSRRHHASITILILVALFVFTNILGFVIAPSLYFLITPIFKQPSLTVMAHYMDACPAINSILNPFVYIVRKKGLRDYVTGYVIQWINNIRHIEYRRSARSFTITRARTAANSKC